MARKKAVGQRESALKERVLDFVRALRARGIPVSPSEELDAMKALKLVDWANREEVRAALLCSLLKDPRRMVDFEELFEEYFGGGQTMPSLFCEGKDPEWKRALEDYSLFLGELHPLIPKVLTGTIGEIFKIARESVESLDLQGLISGLQTGMYARRAFNMHNWEIADTQFSEFLEWLRGKGWPKEQIEALERRYRVGRSIVFEEIRALLERERRRNLDEYFRRGVEDRLLDRPLSALDETELLRARKIARMLAEKLRSRMKLKSRMAGRGRLDAKRTLRINMGCDGVPFRVSYKRKRVEKPEIFVLCDVSSSVARVSQFMLMFVHTLQDCVQRVRSFVFVDSLGEVTDFFREQDVEEGVRAALSRAGIRYNSRSDFGSVFQQFCREYLQDVSFRSFIIVIGDARCNYNDPSPWALERMAERCRGVVWLNPETRTFWDTGDSVMGTYAPFCREVRECRTLRQLEEAVTSILPLGTGV